MSALFNSRWGGPYPPAHSRARCTVCNGPLTTSQEVKTNSCETCWNRPLPASLQWTKEQIDALLFDVLESEGKSLERVLFAVEEREEPEEEEKPSVTLPRLVKVLQGHWSRVMRDASLEDEEDE